MNIGIGATASTARTAAIMPMPAAAAISGAHQAGQRHARNAATAGADNQPAAKMPA
jgi:hypothetical protein